jgi:polar amino acid transport system substrate-binding protein
VYLIDDFIGMEISSESGVKIEKLKAQDKGHSKQFMVMADVLSAELSFPISFDDIYHSTLLTLEAIRSIKEKRVVEIS